MKIKDELKKRAGYVNEILPSYLPHGDAKSEPLYEAMEYSVQAGGKRLRPILMQAASELFSNDAPCIRDFMAAIEMIHTYSLVHDDLPSMDNDLLRRGKPTTHAVYGEGMALQAGDGLLNLAYEIMADACVRSGSHLTSRAMLVMAKGAGSLGMVAGQAADLVNDSTGKKIGLLDLEYICNRKCADLIRVSLEAGAILGGADSGQQDKIALMGEHIGIAFQIRDDILDITGDEQSLGKPVGSDERNGKVTFASLLGIEEAENRVKELSDRAKEILLTLPGDKQFLSELIDYMIYRNS